MNTLLMKRLLHLFWILIFACISCTPATHIYLVRHAEKSGPSGDVPLSAQGFARAQLLAEQMKTKQLHGVYSTRYQRTQQTARPAAGIFGLTPVIYADGDSLMRQLIKAKGKSYLVVGHSNTVLPMVKIAGIDPDLQFIEEDAYHNLYRIKLRNGKAVKLQEFKYGD